MAEDQYTTQDPTQQHSQPEGQKADLAPPGRTGDMTVEPDHGEDSYRGSDRLKDRRAVITGGDSGIGRAVAVACVREGADVLITYFESEEEDAQDTVRLVESAGRRAVAIGVDLREEEQCQRVIDTAVAELGGIDILVNNAAFQMAQKGGIEEISTE